MAAAAGFLLLYVGPAFAQDVNPVPSLELCPDGTPRIVWKYPPEAGLPSNAVPMTCRNGETCYVVPESACLQVVEQSTRQHAREQPRVIEAPEDPASHLLPVSVPRQPATPSPGRPIPVTGVPAPAPATPEQECDAGDGWDFETVPTENPVARIRAAVFA
jgi:hypothetical protein